MSTKLVNKFKDKWGFDTGYKVDSEFLKMLKRQGLPTLAKLLKRFQ